MIKLGIVGTGGMANAHAMAFKNINEVEIVAVCDVIEDRVRNFAKEYNICLLYTSPSPRDGLLSRMPSSA